MGSVRDSLREFCLCVHMRTASLLCINKCEAEQNTKKGSIRWAGECCAVWQSHTGMAIFKICKWQILATQLYLIWIIICVLSACVCAVCAVDVPHIPLALWPLPLCATRLYRIMDVVYILLLRTDCINFENECMSFLLTPTSVRRPLSLSRCPPLTLCLRSVWIHHGYCGQQADNRPHHSKRTKFELMR